MPSAATIGLWGVAAALLGCALALTGLPGLAALLALCLLLTFCGIASRFPASVMGVVTWSLGLVPFNWGLKSGGLPEMYGDEALSLLYLAALPLLYFFARRSWHRGFGRLYFILAALLILESLSFVFVTSSIAYRNFFDGYVLGALLLVLFLQEGLNSKPEVTAKFFTALIITLAALALFERITLRNPVLEHERLYISPELVRLTSGVYRSYVSFFNPSEAGTFIALGIPFVLRQFVQRRGVLSLLGLLIAAAALISNATRGVWVALIFAGLLELRYVWGLLIAMLPVAALGGWITYIALKTTPFMQRLTDPNDLLVRFESWKIIGRVFADNPLIGVGHMRYGSVYLNYVHDVSNIARFDFSDVSVADNLFLTTAAENGLLGLLALVLFFVFALRRLGKLRMKLETLGLRAQASFVRCSELALIIYIVSGCLADLQLFTKATRLMFILVGLGLAEGVRALSSRSAEISR